MSEDRPLVGQTFDTKQQALSGIVKMWSGRLARSQAEHRKTEQKLERLQKVYENLIAQHQTALELMTEEQLEALAVQTMHLRSRDTGKDAPQPGPRTQLPLASEDTGHGSCGCH